MQRGIWCTVRDSFDMCGAFFDFSLATTSDCKSQCRCVVFINFHFDYPAVCVRSDTCTSPLLYHIKPPIPSLHILQYLNTPQIALPTQQWRHMITITAHSHMVASLSYKTLTCQSALTTSYLRRTFVLDLRRGRL